MVKIYVNQEMGRRVEDVLGDNGCRSDNGLEA